jgi:hypothetical protein
MGPGIKTLAVIANMIVELARASADEADWDPDRSISTMQKRVTESPELAVIFLALSDEDQAEVLELILRELSARRAPRA